MSWFKKEEDDGSPRLVAGAQSLINQINSRWTNRSKSGESNQYRVDGRNLIHEIDLNIDGLNGSSRDGEWLIDQIAVYLKSRNPGFERVSYMTYRDLVSSATYPKYFWTWRNSHEYAGEMLHISFTTKFESDPTPFDIPILQNAQAGLWDGQVPFFNTLSDAINLGSPNVGTWRLACRLKELGFFDGQVLPEGQQRYPKNAVRKLQDFMGIQRGDYDEALHKTIWKEFKLSFIEP
jgi:hypothetical protein